VRAYLDGVAWAVPGVLFFRVFFGFTTGIGRPRPVMAFNLLGLTLKVPLNGFSCTATSACRRWAVPAAAGPRRSPHGS
jgi:Na+-driven multidrug efflux pump